nr:unnamed protein product [Spirometra erinaceieuropaei]
MPSGRSKEDVFDLLEHAISDVTGFHKHAQLLAVDPHPEAPDLLLMEVTPAMADQLLSPRSDSDFCFKSFKDSSQSQTAYLCSEDRTFKVLEAETSNSLLLAPNLWIPTKKDNEHPPAEPFVTQANIVGIKSCYLETAIVRAPPLNKLKQLLIKSSFAGHIEEDDRDDSTATQFYSFQELLENVPCSKRELIAALDRLNVMVWEGKCRMFEVEYLNSVIQAIFDLADENAWNWSKDGLPAAAAVLSLEKLYPASVTRQVFQRFFYRRRSATVPPGHVFPRLGKICQLVGEHLLSVTTKFALQDFFSVWCAAVPRGMRPRLRQHLTCAGRAVCESHLELAPAGGSNNAATDKAHRGQSISLLRSEDLPDDSVEARLEVLFARQAVWPEAELAGYMADLVVGAASEDRSCEFVFEGTVEEELIVLSDCEDDAELESIDLNSVDLPIEGGVARVPVVFDKPKPVPAVLGTLLAQHCRASGTAGARVYTEKYPRKVLAEYFHLVDSLCGVPDHLGRCIFDHLLPAFQTQADVRLARQTVAIFSSSFGEDFLHAFVITSSVPFWLTVLSASCSLRELWLDKCELGTRHADLLPLLGTVCTSLRYLSARFNHLCNDQVRALTAAARYTRRSSLACLDLSGNGFLDEGCLKQLAPLPSLCVVFLSDTGLAVSTLLLPGWRQHRDAKGAAVRKIRSSCWLSLALAAEHVTNPSHPYESPLVIWRSPVK